MLNRIHKGDFFIQYLNFIYLFNSSNDHFIIYIIYYLLDSCSRKGNILDEFAINILLNISVKLCNLFPTVNFHLFKCNLIILDGSILCCHVTIS